MKFTAAGDALIQRRMPHYYEGFRKVADFIAQGDFRFVNLETTLNREGECFASQYSGGTWLRTDPSVLEDIREYGFNSLTFANNHSMDYAYNGLLKTLESVEDHGFVNAGVGRNLAEASAPAYLDTPAGRVALIAVTSTFNPAAMAGEQSRRIPGRPGVNGLRFDEKFTVSPEQMSQLKELAQQTNINAAKDITRKEGYAEDLPEGTFELGPIRFEIGEKTARHTSVNIADMKRVEKAIYEASFAADYIVISVHSHELSGDSKEMPSEFLQEFAHKCIDCGANAVIGHGPHLLRPLEIYKKRPIFYSLGDFIINLELLPIAPEDMYAKFGLTSDSTVHELIDKRSHHFTRGLMCDSRMMESVVPYWETDENGDLKLMTLLPVEAGFELPRSQSGFPAVRKEDSILGRYAAMSKDWGTVIRIENGLGVVELG